MNFADFILGSIPMLLQFYAETYYETDFKNTMLELESEYNVPKVKIYDFIVVGGGSAGCVMAGRLSEYFNVLLLEAGGEPPPAVSVPYFTQFVGRHPSLSYFFQSVPQKNSTLCCDGISRPTTGRMLGGSGSYNSMFYSRGSPKDYDNWATILNDNSFNYSNVLKYFRKMETFVGYKFGPEGDEYYGHDGPIVVNTYNTSMLDLWINAGTELGYAIGDPNGFQTEGFTPLNMAIRNGHRSSSYAEYIKPYEESRHTLTVIRYANVTEILLDDDKNAYGVAYTRHGFPQIAHARNEIILSAGTFSSPLLLLKSGIGPESILNAAEIPVKVSLEAVGKNVAEHTYFRFSFSINDSSLYQETYSMETEQILEEYSNGKGILSTTSDGAQCFITSSVAESGWPDIWIRVQPEGDLRLTFTAIIGRPQSKGILSLDTDKYKAGIRDDTQLALIDYKLLTHPDDIEIMLESIKLIFKISETEAFKSINATYTAEPDAACSDFTFLTDDYWKCKVHQDSGPYNHIIGTCSLGPDSGDSVVDTKFRVRGVHNLRIVDASVIPEVTNSNTNAPVMMLAEKAADDIINFYSEVSTATTTTTTTNRIGTPTAESSGTLGTKATLTDRTALFLVLFLIYKSNI